MLADRIAVLRRGRIEQIGTPADVFAAPATDCVAELVRKSGAGLMITAAFLVRCCRPLSGGARPITIASKPFAESYLLAEMFAQLLEARGFRVNRRPGLGATGDRVSCAPRRGHRCLSRVHRDRPAGDSGRAPQRDARAVFRHVATVFPARFDAYWLPPLGFENTYAIAVRPETAAKYGLRTLTDLSRAAPQLTAGLTPDFVGRADGLPGLETEYRLHFAQVRSLLQSVKYQALVSGNVDVIDGYSTDGLIARHHLVVVADDRSSFRRTKRRRW